MSNWKDWLDGEVEHHRPTLKKRINKNVYCKKNRIATPPPTRGFTFGQHIYENGSKECKLCGHTKKEFNQYDRQETDI